MTPGEKKRANVLAKVVYMMLDGRLETGVTH
jgi:hypothetical protein